MDTSVPGLSELIGALKDMRYPTLLLQERTSSPAMREDLRRAAQACGLRFIDYREDVLMSRDPPVLGSYLRTQFREWLREQARRSGGVVVINADDLIGSWGEDDRSAFFVDFLHIESNLPTDATRRAPIVLLSRFAAESRAPTSAFGQGLVADLTRGLVGGSDWHEQ